MNLNPTINTLGRDDQSWLGSAHGTNNARSITLAIAAFTAGTHYPNGFLPSGLALTLYATGPNAGMFGPAGSRSVADGATTSASTTITSATASFTSNDVGSAVSGAGIPAGTTIASVTNGTTAVLSQAATATASSVSLSFVASLAGFLFTATGVQGTTGNPNGALLDHGRVILANLPIAVPANVQSTNAHIIYV